LFSTAKKWRLLSYPIRNLLPKIDPIHPKLGPILRCYKIAGAILKQKMKEI